MIVNILHKTDNSSKLAKTLRALQYNIRKPNFDLHTVGKVFRFSGSVGPDDHLKKTSHHWLHLQGLNAWRNLLLQKDLGQGWKVGVVQY